MLELMSHMSISYIKLLTMYEKTNTDCKFEITVEELNDKLACIIGK